MTGSGSATGPSGQGVWRAVVIFLVSLVIIALQLALMRSFSETHYHHFAYLVISIALLGFGASGVFLALLRDRFERSAALWIGILLAGFVLATVFSLRLAGILPLDTQYLLHDARQLFWFALHNLLILLPFFFGAAVIAAILADSQGALGLYYGLNLLGSGLGGVLAIVLMFILPAHQLIALLSLTAALAFLLWLPMLPLPPALRALAALPILAAGFFAVLVNPAPLVDQYKPLYHMQQLERAGLATRLYEQVDPRGRITVYQSPVFHHTMFTGLGAPLPGAAQLAVFNDGQLAGALFDTTDMADLAILDHTPQALPYRLLRGPRVLIIGDATGAAIWTALRSGAASITAVHTNPALADVLVNRLADRGGSLFRHPRLTLLTGQARLTLLRLIAAGERFELIHLAASEGMPAGSAGLQALHEDWLLTVEGLATAMRLLSADGIIALTRGLQSPPRDNIRILALLAEALRRHAPQNDPADHLLMARNYLAAVTMTSATPVDRPRLEAFMASLPGLVMDAEYFPGIGPDSQRQLNVLPGPPGSGQSWYHWAAQQLLLGDPEVLYGQWMYNVRPTSDDRPYFHDFFSWRAVATLADSYGSLWFQRIELGSAILYMTAALVILSAFVLIPIPLLLARCRRGPGRVAAAGPADRADGAAAGSQHAVRADGVTGGSQHAIRADGTTGGSQHAVHGDGTTAGNHQDGTATGVADRGSRRAIAHGFVLLYFPAIGLGFMFLEMNWIARLGLMLGEPLFAASTVISTLLLSAGAGSILQAHIGLKPQQLIRRAAAGLAIIAILLEVLIPQLVLVLVPLSTVLRHALAAVLIVLPGIVMGMFFAAGLRSAARVAPASVALAWAANGFASVAAAPLAVLLAMSVGYRAVTMLALLCYGLAALAATAAPAGQPVDSVS